MSAFVQKRTTKSGETRWRGVVQTKNLVTSKVESVTKTFDLKRDALDWVAKQRGQKDSMGRTTVPSGEQLGTVFKAWLASNHKVRESTRERYRTIADTYVLAEWSVLAGRRLRQLTPVVLQAWVNDLTRATDKHKALSGATIRLAVAALRGALNHAVRMDLLPTNPVDRLQLPEKRGREVRGLNREQAIAFNQALKQFPEWRALLMLLVRTGLRPGEAFALRWRDLELDTERPVVNVKRAAQLWAPGTPMGKPKTRQGLRSVPVDPELAQVLRDHRNAARRSAMATEDTTWNTSALAFGNDDGNPLTPTKINKLLLRVARVAGLGHIHLYTLRHTAATMWFLSGTNPKVVSRLMGHADVAFTMRQYMDVLDEQCEDAADRMGAVYASK